MNRDPARSRIALRPSMASSPSSASPLRPSNVLFVLALSCFAVPWAVGTSVTDDSLPTNFTIGDLPDDLAPAYSGALEGGPTGTFQDVGINGALAEDDLTGRDYPTGGFPSPLFGAQDFSQKMMRFEEFGTNPLPSSYDPNAPFLPTPLDPQSMPDGGAIDAFLSQPLSPEPQRLSNDGLQNPWQSTIEPFLGRALDTPPIEGRPPGEGWAHQRWSEFFPEVYFQSAQTGARPNGGLRDGSQRHGYAVGEFGPGGLYHSNIAGNADFDGSNQGLEIRFHPNMPEQDPLSVWTFDGTLPPKLLMGRLGESLLFRHYNALPIDPSANMGFGLHTISTHEHNGHNPGESDGYANAFFFPGQFYDYRWPLAYAGHDSINVDATDLRAGTPLDDGSIAPVPGDWRETMSTHWFHDHMLDFTAPNVYKGNAAMFNIYSAVDRGNEAIDDGINLRLPSGSALGWGNRDYDVNLLIADKAWLPGSGQLWFNIFNLDGFIGDRLTTNWQYKPYLDVRARRYRFRILNGSVSRYFKIALVDEAGNRVPFHLVANDGNIMEHAVAMDGSLGTKLGELPVQSIAERYDIVVDFANFEPGDKLYFVNLQEHDDGRRAGDLVPLNEVLSGSYNPVAVDTDGDGVLDEWEDGDPCVGKFLELRVHEYTGVDLSMNPADYVRGGQTMIPLNRPTEAELQNAKRRGFTFGRSSGTDSQPWTIKVDEEEANAGDPRRLSAAPSLGDVEIWRMENGGGGWSHPVHVHFEEGIILSKDGAPPPEWEMWARKDVFRLGPEEEGADEIEIAYRFREFAGSYVEHCHNTQHEDHAMLLRWDLENPGQVLVMPSPLPSWDGVEYVESVALPTFRTGEGVGPTEPIFFPPPSIDDDDGDGWTNEEELACGTNPADSAETPGDFDGDDFCDFIDSDDDNDGWDDDDEVLCGTDPLNALSIPTDTDLDGIGDAVDPDDDNDSVLDVDDPFPQISDRCGDVDGDGCDDCSSGTFDPFNDGPDADADGICDFADLDNDNDGFEDSIELACGSDPLVAASVPSDFDGDGLCDEIDDDDDNDGVLDLEDLAPLDGFRCRDLDGDGCDDCGTGFDAPESDGPDADGDGLCDSGDLDDDNDSWSDADELSCGSDPLVASSQPQDFDGDGVCDPLDNDDDNDGVLDPADSNPTDPTLCADTDGDGCDDCSTGSFDPALDGTDSDGDGVCDSGDLCPGFDDAIDCNGNATPDGCDLTSGTSVDTNANGIPDECEGELFIRGDGNSDGIVDLSDAIYTLFVVFEGLPPTCALAVDCNDDDALDVSDVVSLLGGLFTGGPAAAAPYPECGLDPTPSHLDCLGTPQCP